MVPVGTEVWDDGLDDRLLVDLTQPGQRATLAKGGRGGRGNVHFATPTNRFPLLAEEGEAGEALTVRLELKLLADVGIVGAPNAGKSTLLAALTAARPKIAGYPFTTLEPTLGVVLHRDSEFVMVDIPGLIEGSHAGAGLGHEFLRHVDRTRVIVHLVDGSLDDPVREFTRVTEELRLFNSSLVARPQVVAINKTDVPGAHERAEAVKGRLARPGTPVLAVSGATRDGLDVLLDEIIRALEEARAVEDATPQEVPIIRPRPVGEKVKVRKRGATFVVNAPPAARIAGMIDDTDWNAMTQFYAHLRRLGVVKALELAGVGPGDKVAIGKLEMEWE